MSISHPVLESIAYPETRLGIPVSLLTINIIATAFLMFLFKDQMAGIAIFIPLGGMIAAHIYMFRQATFDPHIAKIWYEIIFPRATNCPGRRSLMMRPTANLFCEPGRKYVV